MYLYEGRCEASCPEKYYPSLNNESQLICSYCHYSCKVCFGPNDYECVSCYGDAVLKQISKSENYCYSKAILPALETTKWFYWMFLAFMANVILIVLLLTYFLSCKLFHSYSLCKKQNYEYSSMNDVVKEPMNHETVCISDSESDTWVLYYVSSVLPAKFY